MYLWPLVRVASAVALASLSRLHTEREYVYKFTIRVWSLTTLGGSDLHLVFWQSVRPPV